MAENIEISGLSKRFGRKAALQDISLSLQAGEVLGLLGPNGAGKSTLISILAGLLRVDSGTVRVLGRDPWAQHVALAPRVGVLLERPGVYDHLSPRQHLTLFARMNRTEVNTGRVLALAGIEALADRKAGQLSLGMRQRLALALAMMNEPELLLLDEPSTGLDVEGTHELFALLRRISDESGVTILVASHQMDDIERISDRVAVLHEGRLLRCERTDALLTYDKRYVTVLLEGAENAAKKLTELSWVASVEARRGRMDVRLSGGSIHQLNQFLLQSGYAVSGLIPRRRSLSDYFLRVLERSDNPEAASLTMDTPMDGIE